MPARVKLMVPYNSLELAGFVKVPSGDNCWLLRVKSIYEAYQNQFKQMQGKMQNSWKKKKEKCQAERLIESYVRFSQSEDRMLSQQGISGHVLLR